MVQPTSEQTDEERTGALVGRLFEAALGTMDVMSVYLGDRLGLYRALAGSGGSTSQDLAARAAVDERYAREWFEQQAVTGILEVDDPGRPDRCSAGTHCRPPTPLSSSTWTA